jgi:hypothetical protein
MFGTQTLKIVEEARIRKMAVTNMKVLSYYKTAYSGKNFEISWSEQPE